MIEGSPCRDDQCVFLHLVVLRRFRFLFETPGLAFDSQVIPSFTANGSTRFSSRGILVQDDGHHKFNFWIILNHIKPSQTIFEDL